MARVVPGVAGTFRGKVGGIVFSKALGGVETARQYQPNVANPNSPAQQTNRIIQASAARLSAGLKVQGVFANYFKVQRAPYRSAYTSVIGEIRTYVTETEVLPSGTVVASAAQLAVAPVVYTNGRLSRPIITDVNGATINVGNVTGEIVVNFNWNTNKVSPYDMDSDDLYLLTINTRKGVVSVVNTNQTRSEGSVDYTYIPSMAFDIGETLLVVPFFASADLTYTSPGLTLAYGIVDDTASAMGVNSFGDTYSLFG